MSVKRKIITVVKMGTVKSSHVLGEANSINVAKALVIKENITESTKSIWICVIGFVTPSRVNENKHNKNPLTKNANEPSKVLIAFIQGIFISCFPYFFPITEANVSEMIIIKIPAIGKYI